MSRGRDTVSRALTASAIRDGVNHGQMRFIHSHLTPPTSTILRRAPRSLGSALTKSFLAEAACTTKSTFLRNYFTM